MLATLNFDDQNCTLLRRQLAQFVSTIDSECCTNARNGINHKPNQGAITQAHRCCDINAVEQG